MAIPRIDEARLLASDAFTVAQFLEQKFAREIEDRALLLHNQLLEVRQEILNSNEALVAKSMNEVVFHVDQKQIQIDQSFENRSAEFFEKVGEIEKATNLHISNFRFDLNSLRRSISTTSNTSESRENIGSNSETNAHVIDDILYVALEDAFRGDRDIVAERQTEYIPFLGDAIDENHPLVDLGCGRGEWLKLLKERGIPARGVDENSVCVTECLELGLDVQRGDLMSFLRECKDNSLGAITLFQVFEHLPFPVLVDCLQEIQRVLAKGGVLIAEIPNAKNVRVGSGTFWIDPTHQRPLFPEVLQFLATYVGFNSVDGRYSNRLGPEHNLDGLPDGARAALESAMQALDGPGDFALIATA